VYQNERVINSIKAYDDRLYVTWNNGNSLWEVWRKMPWGDRIITPITHNIYDPGAGKRFAPLDHRIVYWLYSADTQKKDLHLSWKYRAKRNFLNTDKSGKAKYKRKLLNSAKDNYYILNNEMISMFVEDTDWKRPEVQSKSRARMMYRKKYYEYDSN